MPPQQSLQTYTTIKQANFVILITLCGLFWRSATCCDIQPSGMVSHFERELLKFGKIVPIPAPPAEPVSKITHHQPPPAHVLGGGRLCRTGAKGTSMAASAGAPEAASMTGVVGAEFILPATSGKVSSVKFCPLLPAMVVGQVKVRRTHFLVQGPILNIFV